MSPYRLFLSKLQDTGELHAFSEAIKLDYVAAVHERWIIGDPSCNVTILLATNQIASMNSALISCLELDAAVLAAGMVRTVTCFESFGWAARFG